MNFSIEQLLAFVTVYNQLSFSKAAVKLNKHRTTVGQVIGNLEDQLAVTLFERIGRSVEPTEDGHLLYHYAKQTLEQARVFDKVALSLSYGGLESITIASSPIIPDRALAQIRQKLAKDFPTMRVNFTVKDKSEIKKGIESGEIHFGLVNIHDSRAIHSFDSTLLGHIEYVPFISKFSEEATLPVEVLMGALKTKRQFVLKAFVDDEIKEKILLSANHEEIEQKALIIKMVREDLGWAWLPRNLAESEYVTDNLIAITDAPQMKQGFKFATALWCPHSKQVVNVKKSIVASILNYIDYYKTIA
ncbi:LysR family transcriptional regulator [Vibrio sp. FNV 38]|nr:LysR family transcriptional regulator [Vibrio sp. FNV 38]